jgi:3-oxoacyl-[acyl-carrier protein] reductase
MENKHVFITGGSRGIGAATALYFADKAYDVTVCYHTAAEKAEAVATGCRKAGVRAQALRADVGVFADAAAAWERACGTFGVPSAVVTAAGVAFSGLIQDHTDADTESLLRVNLAGTINVLRAAAPALVGRKRGAIVTVASMWGICGAACESVYAATKGGVIALTKSLARELAPSGITVNCIAPGATQTDMLKTLSAADKAVLEAETPLARLAAPAEIAAGIYFLATQPFTTGQILSPNGGMVI